MTGSPPRVAVVTGGGRGIGRGIATVLAAKGAAVAVWDLNLAGAEETVDAIRATGGTALAVGTDAADADDIAAAAVRTRAELGPVTILVNNAGISAYAPFVDIDRDAWDRMIRINLTGPFLTSQELLPDMLSAGWGRIVNISSAAAQSGAPAMGHYAASKGGVIGLTKALALELAATGVTVNNVPPGLIDTPMVAEGGVDAQAAGAYNPMKRPGSPEDVAHAVAYLVSEEASYITGQTLSANGGQYMV